MRNLFEILHNTVAFFFVMRILIAIVLLAFAGKLVYNFLHYADGKKFWSDRKKHLHRHRGVIRTRTHKTA